jgi:hypothetical protein
MRWDNRWDTFMNGYGMVNGSDLPALGPVRFSVSGPYTAVPTAFSILSSNETDLAPGWHYFASPAYLASHPQITDGAPRVWYLANYTNSQNMSWGYGGISAGPCPHGTVYSPPPVGGGGVR